MSIFTEVQNRKVGSNTFDLSHDKKMSLKMGLLVPIHCMEIVPGDSIKMSTSQLMRMAPMVTPIMHQVNIYTHFFFVPNRIVWKNWNKFITGGEDGFDATVFPTTRMNLNNNPNGSLADYFGIPTTENVLAKVSALPFFAYNKIYNEYYRDQNLVTALPDEAVDGINLDIGNDMMSEPYKRAWQHDYFTSALPWTQKGPEATIPLGTTAPLILKDTPLQSTLHKASDGTTLDFGNNVTSGVAGSFKFNTENAYLDNSGALMTDLSQATASSINDLRRAFKLQEWLEKNARGGSRYVETILSHFGVRSSDARLQRPEFLGGGTNPMVISEVLQTSANATEPTPQGNMAGHGVSVGGNNSFRYTAEEHGYIIGIMSVMPKPAYFQGLPKHFLKFDKFQYYWPSFAHLGEQPIENQEIFLSLSEATNQDTFGYTPRYAEYKFINSSVHGEFRDSLDFWHMGRKFDNLPALNKQFIECDPTTRVFAVEQTEQLYAHVYHKIKASRKMPYFGTPTL